MMKEENLKIEFLEEEELLKKGNVK